MKSAIRVAMFLAIASALPGCGKAPTEPSSSFPDRIPTPSPGELSGTWAGTYAEGSCSEAVQVGIGHRDDHLSGSFSSHCVGSGEVWVVELNGTIRGATVDIVLSTNDQNFASLHGYASPSAVDVESRSSNLPATSLRLSRSPRVSRTGRIVS